MSLDADRLHAALDTIARPIAVAVSGGIDSLTLATMAHRHKPGQIAMFHAVSPAVPGDATARVERLAHDLGWTLRIIDAGEFEDADYRANPTNRCFFCKTNLYGSIARHTDHQMVSGANLDDLGEYRPGLDAAKNNDVRHPFLEAGINKRSVRQLAVEAGLGGLSELPAAPCLSSRIETGIPIQADMLRAIHEVERQLAQDFPQGTIRCRVRAQGLVIEADPVTLEALDAARQNDVSKHVESRFAGLMNNTTLAFAPYRNGSAFLHG